MKTDYLKNFLSYGLYYIILTLLNLSVDFTVKLSYVEHSASR